MARIKLERYCSCGGELIVESDGYGPLNLADDRFSEIHAGEGHAPVSKREVARAQRRQLLRDVDELRRGHPR